MTSTHRARYPACAPALAVLLLAGCGGGGSSAALPKTGGGGNVIGGAPGVTSTPLPGGLPASGGASTASCASLTAATPGAPGYGITSTPAGLPISVNGAVCSVPTNAIFALPNTSTATMLAIVPKTGSPYTYAYSSGTANAQFYFNAAEDTSGTVLGIGASSALRGTAPRAAQTAVRSLARAAGRPIYSPDQLAVTYKTAVLAASGRAPLDLERASGVASARPLGDGRAGLSTRVLTVASGTSVDATLQALAADPAVAVAERVQMRYPTAAATVNDPGAAPNVQWDLTRIGAFSAWGSTTGAPSVQVAIVDSGIDTSNEDFAGGKVTYGESDVNGVTTVGTGEAGSLDHFGHGTNVAGIAAAGTNDKLGFAGVGYKVGLQAYRIFPQPQAPCYTSCATYGATTADEVTAIQSAVKHGAKVINLSLGSPTGAPASATEQAAVEAAIQAGVTVVAAAGNDGASSVDYPAGYPGVISVGASSLQDNGSGTYSSAYVEGIASYSNYGTGLGLVAPGGDPTGTSDSDFLHWITNDWTTVSTDPTEKCTPGTASGGLLDPGACFALVAGTSQAAPHVAGAAALLLSLNPGLTPANVAALLETNADNIGDARAGHGRLNVGRAVAALVGGPAAPSTAAGPGSTVNAANYVAFAYTNSGGTTPAIADLTYPTGMPLSAGGTFRIADVPPTVPTYRIAVWADRNGDGVVDAGDSFGVSGPCTTGVPCASAQSITVAAVPAGFVLP